jgi:peptide chain release factor 1
MLAKLESLEARCLDLEKDLADPDVFSNQERYRKLAKAHADLAPVVGLFRKYRDLLDQLRSSREVENDPDPAIRAMAQDEARDLQNLLGGMERDLKTLLLPQDPLDGKNVLLEVRAGTGGEEAALFASDLFRMYCRYGEKMGWNVEVLSQSASDAGGLKEIIALISGDRVYSRLKFESGAHRVQRVPVTETQGRIHTSAATVAVMPEAEEVDVNIRPEDLRVDVYRAGGAGGQHVNKTESAVRVTHIPTGIVAICQDEKSQHKNKAQAMKVIAARILQAERDRQDAASAAARRALVGSGDRSERIRTYNFPQGRVTDHRISLTLYALDRVMEGEIQPLLDGLSAQAQTEALRTGVVA